MSEQRDSQEVFTSYINGTFVSPSSNLTSLVDPSTGLKWAAASQSPQDVELAVASAKTAFENESWSGRTQQDRARLLQKLGELVHENAEALGRLESLATGKPHSNTFPEMRSVKLWLDYYAHLLETADDVHRDISGTREALIKREPLGVVVAITPFNGAVSLGCWKLAPALAMGNVVILKPPHDAPASTLLFAELALKAGFPRGVVNVVIADPQAGEALAVHPDVAMVSFTGSTRAAAALGARVSEGLKRFVSEAGGKSAHIIFEDADLDSAVIAATQGAFAGSGQTCVAGSRVLVHRSIYDEFLARFAEMGRKVRVGVPSSERTHIGPIASKRQFDRICSYVDGAVSEGAKLIIGGKPLTMEGSHSGGFWYPPTILVNVKPEMRVFREEIFGPVAVVVKFADDEEAVKLANDSDYGLAAGFWTKDLNRRWKVSKQLQAGTIWVNTYRAIDRKIPFGGFKKSGTGRENGPDALHEYCQLKAIVTEYGPAQNQFF